MRLRVRRSAKKSFHVSAFEPGAGVALDAEGEVDALRRAILLGRARSCVETGVCECCWGSLLGRVLVEKEAMVEQGARMEGGCRLAKARAGQKALLASIVVVVVKMERWWLRVNFTEQQHGAKLWSWRDARYPPHAMHRQMLCSPSIEIDSVMRKGLPSVLSLSFALSAEPLIFMPDVIPRFLNPHHEASIRRPPIGA